LVFGPGEHLHPLRFAWLRLWLLPVVAALAVGCVDE